MGCREADELQDDEGAYREDDAAALAKRVEEDLRNGLGDWACKDGDGITHDKAKDNVEEETSNVGEQHGQGNRPRCLEFGLRDSNIRQSLDSRHIRRELTPR